MHASGSPYPRLPVPYDLRPLGYAYPTLGEDEAARFLDALETVDEDTVARLADLRSR